MTQLSVPILSMCDYILCSPVHLKVQNMTRIAKRFAKFNVKRLIF